MNTRAPKLEVKAEADGRISYTVAGVLTVYDAQEAIDLMQTGAFKINCPLTQQANKGPRHLTRVKLTKDPVSGMPGVQVEQYEVDL